MKGYRKRKNKSIFSVKNTWSKNRVQGYPKYTTSPTSKYVRVDANTFDGSVKCQKGVYSFIDAEGYPVNTGLLRPTLRPKTVVEELDASLDDSASHGVSSVDLEAVEDVFEKVLLEHSNSTHCDKGLSPKLLDVRSWGATCKTKWGCRNCKFVSKNHYKMYSEPVEGPSRGPKPAKINIGLAMGLTSTSVGVEGMRDIMHHMNQPAPAKRHMNKQVTKAYTKVKTVNEEDMSARRKSLHNLQKSKGLQPEAPIRAEGDGRYNNKVNSGGGMNPFQAGTQQSYVLCENETRQKQVISVSTHSKLCHKGQLLRAQGIDVVCPGGHDGCTANLDMAATIGDEGRAVAACLDSMKDDNNINIGVFTSDGDSQAPNEIKRHQPHIEVDTARDPRHFKQTHKHNMYTHMPKFSNSLFSTSFLIIVTI